MSLFGQAKPSLFGQTQTVQTPQPVQPSNFPYWQGQNLNGTQQQANTLGASMVQQQQSQQMPTLSQSQAQLSNSLWQPGKETPRMSFVYTHEQRWMT